MRDAHGPGTTKTPATARVLGRADERIRTADPFITSEVLYQLSYVGAVCRVAKPRVGWGSC